MTIEINYFSAPASSALGSVISPALSFVTGFAPSSADDYALGSVADSAPDLITFSAPDIVSSRIALVLIDPIKSNFFYGKQVTIEDFRSSKLYMKKTIWIRQILFGEKAKVELHLSILDEI